ncbi:MAG: alkaline phosphatase family protein [Candidatus Eisenbacteria bacterium]|uniref:Alkaline phosphatase family protein n=1 Tax=Eiseniibacteriota bacterium TaxID=2212470 RepID=A0A956RMX2_UNCEI|nr:alkaline phosphatase family protein [Candidatus Eisenbacteria bacterium]
MIGHLVPSPDSRSFGPTRAGRKDKAHRTYRLVGVTALLALLAAVGVGLVPAPSRAEEGPSKVVILGFDGADAQMVRDWMDAGELPNLDRLRKQGTFSDLRPTNPPQTPVSWSTFATGLDPGSTEIFDFLKRDVKTYAPDFAMTKPSEAPFAFGPKNPLYLSAGLAAVAFLILLILGALFRRARIGLLLGLVAGVGAFLWARPFVAENVPEHRPIAINQRQGTPFWQILGDRGINSTVIRVPQTFPPDPNPGGRLLSGLGVPDIRGTFGTYSFYTSEVVAQGDTDTEMGGKVVLLDVERGDPEVKTILYGPFNKLFPEPPEIFLPLTISMDWDRHAVQLHLPDQVVDLEQGQWSDFVQLEFPIRKLIKVHGIARFYLIELDREIKLYMSPINIDPVDPIVPITSPKGFAQDIHDQIGNWKTLGWALDTWSLNENVLPEEVFAEDFDFTVGKFEQILDSFFDNPENRLYCQVFYFTDRAGHMFYRFLDPTHPAYDPALAPKWGDFILQSYKRMDAIVGHVMERLPEDGVLLVCSDHGFANWKRSFNMNTWLVRNGFMTLKGQDQNKLMTLDDLFVEGQFWPNVDWERTRVYALGLGALYVNLLGREKYGIVTPGAEYDQLCRDVAEKMEAYIDPETGEHPIFKVYRRDEMYNKFDPDIIPDMRAANNLGYRVSWQTSLGGVPREMFEENKDKWSGDHCSLDPSLVHGILFCNRPLRVSAPGIEDLFPTILSMFGVPVPNDADGKALPFAN